MLENNVGKKKGWTDTSGLNDDAEGIYVLEGGGGGGLL